MGLIKKLISKKEIITESPLAAAHGNYPIADFIPYAVFFDDHTIVTKNGELVQTLKIPLSAHGLPSEDAEHTGVFLRDIIRNNVAAFLTTPEFSHWVHIFRDRDPIDPLPEPAEDFAKKLQEEWLASQRTNYSYHNVCYVSIVIQGQTADLFDVRDYKKGGHKRKNRHYRATHLNEQAKRLEAAVSAMMRGISEHFKVERLGMVERQIDGKGVYFSQQLEWLNRLINLTETAMPVQEVTIAEQLESADLIFGFDAMEARQKRQKRFISLLSLKHYHELPPTLLDRFIQMPVEMIITQASHYIESRQVMSEEGVIKKVLDRSEDGFIAEKSGYLEVVQADQGQPTDFSSQQTTIMLIFDHYSELDDITSDMQSQISSLGLLSVREDIKLEEIFWSQLPGNFEFLRRMQGLPSQKTNGLARLNFYPTGKLKSHWGPPITILPTNTRTPYLFHFHQETVGHSAIIDFNSFPDSLGYRLTHFLSAAASKQARVIMFDRHGSGEMFINSMNGQYARIGGKSHNLSLNPLAMECTPGNQGFLAAWLSLILKVGPEDAQARAAIRTCVAEGWDEQTASEGFSYLVTVMQRVHPAMGEILRQYMQQPVAAAVLSSGLDSFNINHAVSGINIHLDAFREGVAVAMFSLLLHRSILTLDGSPTLLVIKDAWDVLDHPFFASRLKSLMDMLTEKNAAILFTTRQVDKLAASAVTPIIVGELATKLIIPDDIPSDYLHATLGYTTAEEKVLARLERQKGDLLVVHGEEVVSTKLTVKNATQVAILSGDSKTLQAMKSA